MMDKKSTKKYPLAPAKKVPTRAANARGLDRAALAEAKIDTALKSMEVRRAGKAKFPAANSFMERRLFNESTKLYKERDAIRDQTKRDVGDKGRR
jgi:hypothetical protein